MRMSDHAAGVTHVTAAVEEEQGNRFVRKMLPNFHRVVFFLSIFVNLQVPCVSWVLSTDSALKMKG